MPKLPHVSGAQLVRALERLGFVVARQSGSHIILRKGSTGCVVPNHKEIKVGTLAGILRQAGISSDDFLRVLKD
jgi:predicted RNA binding protein YcfA (HicA-like mRNA interferase family)